MPAAVKSKEDESHWHQARQLVATEYPEVEVESKRYWELCMEIFRRLKFKTGGKPAPAPTAKARLAWPGSLRQGIFRRAFGRWFGKAESFGDREMRIRDAFNAAQNDGAGKAMGCAAPTSAPYVQDVFTDYVVVRDGADCFRVPYAIGEDGTIKFEIDKKQRVTREWVAKAAETYRAMEQGVRSAFDAKTRPANRVEESSPSAYVTEVYSDRVIVRVHDAGGEGFFSIPYTRDEDGKIAFNFAARKPVKQEWVSKAVGIFQTAAAHNSAELAKATAARKPENADTLDVPVVKAFPSVHLDATGRLVVKRREVKGKAA